MRVGVLVSEYPAVSHAFIRREVKALREGGLEVETFAIRRAPLESLPSPEDRAEWERTSAVMPAGAVAVAAALGLVALRRPGRFLAALVQAITRRPPGVRALVWSLFYLAEAALLARALERRGISHLHVHFANAGAEVAVLAAGLVGIAYSLTLHGTADLEYPAGLGLGAKIETARFVACASHFLRAQAMRTVAPEVWSKLFVSRCGVDLARIPALPSRIASDGPLRVLCVARLSVEKGHAGLLEGFETLLRQGVAARLRLVGEGPERERVERVLRERGLERDVTLVGSLGEAELWKEYEAADVFVLPSLMEGLPVVLMEAMAFGLPVVAPRLGGIPELVEEGRGGLLFDPARWEMLAERLRVLSSDPGLRRRLGETARARIEAEYAIERAAAPLLARLREAGA